MSRQNPRYIEAGLDPAEAYAIAQFMGWTNALADAVLSGKVSREVGLTIAQQAQRDVETLMLDGTISEGNAAEAALSPDNSNFAHATDVLANNLEKLAAEMEAAQEQEDAAND